MPLLLYQLMNDCSIDPSKHNYWKALQTGTSNLKSSVNKARLNLSRNLSQVIQSRKNYVMNFRLR